MGSMPGSSATPAGWLVGWLVGAPAAGLRGGGAVGERSSRMSRVTVLLTLTRMPFCIRERNPGLDTRTLNTPGIRPRKRKEPSASVTSVRAPPIWVGEETLTLAPAMGMPWSL
jgi:hypothetical protein